jgi:polyhydroxybutyrate depolymerase
VSRSTALTLTFALAAVAAGLLSLVATPAHACDLPPGQRTIAVDVQGVRREALVFVGAQVRPGVRPPLVFTWHGWGGSAANVVRAVRPDTHWADGVVVAAHGLPRTLRELDPRFDGPAQPGWQILAVEHGGRDLALFDALLAQLEQRGCADPKRIYAAGFSNGGFFSNLLGCQRGARLAAIAPIGGGGPFPGNLQRCPGPMVPTLIVHGLRDRVVPIRQAAVSLELWQRQARCAATPMPAVPGCTEPPGCNMRVCLFPGGHSWPQDVATLIERFFRQHQR